MKPIFSALLVILEPILDVLTLIVKATEAVAKFATTKGPAGGNLAAGQQQANAALLGRNDNVVQSQSTTTNRSQVDIMMQGLSRGTTVKQTGNAPGVSLNYGYAQGNL